LSPSELWATFWRNVVDALLVFNVEGDLVPANTIPGEPALGLVSGGLLVLGIVYLLYRLVRHREREALYTLTCFVVLLLPSVLSLAFPEENPSLARMGGAVAVVMIIVALPLDAILRRVRALPGAAGPRLAGVLLAALLLIATVDNYRWYFLRYDTHILASSINTTEIAQEVREFVAAGGSMSDVYHVSFPHWADTRNIAINAGDITWRQAVLDLGDIEDHAADPAPKLYLLYAVDHHALTVLRRVYPEGRVARIDSERPKGDFLVFRVPAR
jgi:hypothetical protein